MGSLLPDGLLFEHVPPGSDAWHVDSDGKVVRPTTMPFVEQWATPPFLSILDQAANDRGPRLLTWMWFPGTMTPTRVPCTVCF